MRFGMTSNSRIEFHIAGHCERGLHAVLSEAPEFVGDALVLCRRPALSNMIECASRRSTVILLRLTKLEN
jgi:hypothetical protein